MQISIIRNLNTMAPASGHSPSETAAPSVGQMPMVPRYWNVFHIWYLAVLRDKSTKIAKEEWVWGAFEGVTATRLAKAKKNHTAKRTLHN